MRPLFSPAFERCADFRHRKFQSLCLSRGFSVSQTLEDQKSRLFPAVRFSRFLSIRFPYFFYLCLNVRPSFFASTPTASPVTSSSFFVCLSASFFRRGAPGLHLLRILELPFPSVSFVAFLASPVYAQSVYAHGSVGQQSFFRNEKMSIRSLSDLQRREDGEKKNTSSFTGGERSGLAVENPSDEESPIGDFAHAVRGAAPPGARRVTVYRNGFIVDDGEFRSLEDPDNVRFLDELKAGFAPRELQEGGRRVHVELVNKQSEVYHPPPPPAYVLFSGDGQRLSADEGVARGTSAPRGEVDVSRGAVAVDESQPTTMLQFRLHDGQRRTQRFNETHTIADLREFVSQVAPVNGEVRLLEGFPPKEITAAPSATIKEAGLLNAAIVQKIC
ncbi:UBX domain-containing protein [Toxoplasma gondii MAS]|uniref:UBX domain-containing protein n=1 Tax=Toxoplasma gondii MAS TaxID=943118 RepID=A0A086PYG8_TOXGO|nr:UBX domain-containing protein [Toxoplasma gondii MAS]